MAALFRVDDFDLPAVDQPGEDVARMGHYISCRKGLGANASGDRGRGASGSAPAARRREPLKDVVKKVARLDRFPHAPTLWLRGMLNAGTFNPPFFNPPNLSHRC
jgi:hypothetical protein